MDDLQTSDELTFIPEQIEPIVYECIESVLKDKSYNDLHVQGWVDEICSRLTKDLIDTNKPFKYIVSCAIMQKNGAGLHVGHSAHWDAGNDNCLVTRWPNDKRKDPNARVVCVISVFGLGY
mmetsp:Transcript_35772/g.36480  ORF Transcript_35772/g.36480 Transcript_35772/m.36480 type:complete len:121 (+) Transcript_35772:240-602(+)